MVLACHPITGEAEGSEVKCHPQLHRELGAYMRPISKERNWGRKVKFDLMWWVSSPDMVKVRSECNIWSSEVFSVPITLYCLICSGSRNIKLFSFTAYWRIQFGFYTRAIPFLTCFISFYHWKVECNWWNQLVNKQTCLLVNLTCGSRSPTSTQATGTYSLQQSQTGDCSQDLETSISTLGC